MLKEFLKFDKVLDQLLGQEKYQDAIDLMIEKMSDYPDEQYLLYGYIMFCYRSLKQWDKCSEWLNSGLDQGLFYSLEWSGWDEFRSHQDYPAINERVIQQRSEYAKKSEPKAEVHLPADYDSSKKYPLLIVLHGDGLGCNIEFMKHQWGHSKQNNAGWIVAYLQSSRPYCNHCYGWVKDYSGSRNEIDHWITKITSDYSVDESRIVLSGFSGGAMASLNFLGNNVRPLAGVIALCPNDADDTAEANFKGAAENGTAVVILEGDQSKEPYQQQLMEIFNRLKISARFVENKDIGHMIPEDMEDKVLEATDFILSK